MPVSTLNAPTETSMPKPSPLKTKPTLLVTDGVHASAVDLLNDWAEVVYEKSLSPEALLKHIATVDGVMIRSASKITAEVLAHAPNLKIIGRAGVGVDNVDVPAATERGIVVINSPEGNTVAAAEHTIGMLFALARNIPQGDAALKQGHWQRSQWTGVELFGKTLGIIGLGKIGSRVAKTALSLGMTVLVFDPVLTADRAERLGVELAALDTVLQQADFITIHAPKTRETTHLLNKTTLAQCKPGVRLINCARGGIIHEGDLVEALKSGQVAGAALDVFETEPLAADHPLLTMGDNVVITPHLGASTHEAQINVALDVARQFKQFFTEGIVDTAVNLPYLKPDILEPVKVFMPMASALGQMLGQMAALAMQRGAKTAGSHAPLELELIGRGELADVALSPLSLAALKGVLGEFRDGVSMVNARALADEMGMIVKESTIASLRSLQNMLTITLKGPFGQHQLSGSLLGEGVWRIVAIDGYPMALEPTAHMLLTPHVDKPGMVALVSSILGHEQVNIRAMQVAARANTALSQQVPSPWPETASMMVFNVDNPIPPAAIEAIRAQSGIHDVVYVQAH